MSLAGRIAYQLWHRPLGGARECVRHGGPLAQLAVARGRADMRRAAATLPILPARAGSTLSVHFLTGRQFAYQTAFCLYTLVRHGSIPISAELYDDGSLDHSSRDLVRRLLPATRIHDHDTLVARLDEFLPASRFPVLRERWVAYPHIRKLIDIHLGSAGWKLVLDSDLLFWRRPEFLISWATAPAAPLHAVDCEENYGYSRALLERIAGKPVPRLLNVGLCGLRSESIDWDFLEYAAATLISEAGTSYYLEQGLVALLAARHPGPCAAAPAGDYITHPSAAEIAAPSAVMHHYVDLSRDAYHLHAWRRAIA